MNRVILENLGILMSLVIFSDFCKSGNSGECYEFGDCGDSGTCDESCDYGDSG